MYWWKSNRSRSRIPFSSTPGRHLGMADGPEQDGVARRAAARTAASGRTSPVRRYRSPPMSTGTSS